MAPAWFAAVFVVVALTGPLPAHAADDKAEALPTTLSVMPGVLVHGTGHFAAGDSDTGWRLLGYQGLGLGAAGLGFGGLAATGGARKTAGLFVALGFAGLFPFAASWMADLVGTVRRGERLTYAAPPGAGLQPYGVRLRTSAGILVDGYAGVGALTRLQLHARSVGVFIEPQLVVDLAGHYDRATLRGGWVGQPGSRLRLEIGGEVTHRFQAAETLGFAGAAAGSGISRLVVLATMEAVLDLRALAPEANGAWSSLRLGYGGQVASYDGGFPTDDFNEVLEVRTAIGAHLSSTVSIEAAYSHRRDWITGGLPGFRFFRGWFGNVGVQTRWAFSDGFAAGLLLNRGSDTLVEASFEVRL